MSTEIGGPLVEGISGALLVGLAGFLYLHGSYFQRFQLASAKQQTRTSLAFAYGLGFLILASLIGTIITVFLPGVSNLLDLAWKAISPLKNLNGVFGAAPTIGLLLGFASNLYRLITGSDRDYLKNTKHPLFTTNLFARMRYAALADVATSTEDQMLWTLWRAITLGKLVQVTLKSRKVYIGAPLASRDPSVESLWLKIVPIASGFRVDETLSYIPTTDYRDLFERLAQTTNAHPNGSDPSAEDSVDLVTTGAGIKLSFDPKDVGILLPWSEIISMTIYDPALEAFFLIKNPEPIEEIAASEQATRERP